MVGRQVVPADGVDPQDRAADERRDVDADPLVKAVQVVGHAPPGWGLVVRGRAVETGVHLDQGIEVGLVPERRVAESIDPDDLGRHSLADLGLVARLAEQPQPAVAVKVDEPGRDDLAGRVDDVGGCCRITGLVSPAPGLVAGLGPVSQ